MMECLNTVLRKAILQDDYLSIDESYYSVLTKEKDHQDKGIRKGYIWTVLGNNTKLVQYFFEDDSRSREVLTNYISNNTKGPFNLTGLRIIKFLKPTLIRI